MATTEKKILVLRLTEMPEFHRILLENHGSKYDEQLDAWVVPLALEGYIRSMAMSGLKLHYHRSTIPQKKEEMLQAETDRQKQLERLKTLKDEIEVEAAKLSLDMADYNESLKVNHKATLTITMLLKIPTKKSNTKHYRIELNLHQRALMINGMRKELMMIEKQLETVVP